MFIFFGMIREPPRERTIVFFMIVCRMEDLYVFCSIDIVFKGACKVIKMNLSEYFAGRTCVHVRDSVGKGSSFPEGLFERPVGRGDIVRVWQDYELRFEDQEPESPNIRVYLERRGGVIPNGLGKQLLGLRVRGYEKRVLSRISVDYDDDRITFEVFPKAEGTTSQRTTNKDRLFFALYRTVTKPILMAVHEHCKR